VTIRPYAPGDGALLAAIFVRSIEGIGVRDYTPDQVAAWAGRRPAAERFDTWASDGRTALVALNAADQPVAFGDVEADGHIDLLYCAPEAAGTGVTAQLYVALETAARKQGVTRLYSEASEAARRFFLKQGFTVLHRRDFEVAGVPIHNYAVEKTLG
jgi:putative acetyltransferase